MPIGQGKVNGIIVIIIGNVVICVGFKELGNRGWFSSAFVLALGLEVVGDFVSVGSICKSMGVVNLLLLERTELDELGPFP